MKNTQTYWLALVAVVLYSCAQRATLTGGDKDVLPPELKETLPENQSLNFTAKEIVVEFNEFVKLNNLQNQLIVSPPMEETPEIRVKGKKVIIKLLSELAENTTYSLNFGDAIVDITEDNPYPNYKYVFSTGSYIDSLEYSGTVVNAENITPAKSIFVMLYNELEDSLPLKQQPNYLAKTKADGTYTITNVAKGRYKVFALDDINGNYLYDLPNEPLAFLNNPIELDSSLSNNMLYLFTKESELQFVKRIENKTYGKLEVELNIPSLNLELFTIDEKPVSIANQEIDKTNTKHTFWLNQLAEQQELTFILKDNGKTIDTSKVEMVGRKEFTDTFLVVSDNVSALFDLNQNIELIANHPVASLVAEKISLLQDDTIPVKFDLIKDSLSGRKISIVYQFKENKKYQLRVEEGAFSSIYQLQNDTIMKSFKTKKEENYGNLKMTVVPTFRDNYIFQLIQKDEVIKEFFEINEKTFTVPYLKPGEYQVKLIVDSNNNKKWDTGNYQNNLQPERVVLYEDKITIQENWDNEIKWNIKL